MRSLYARYRAWLGRPILNTSRAHCVHRAEIFSETIGENSTTDVPACYFSGDVAANNGASATSSRCPLFAGPVTRHDRASPSMQ